MSFIQLTQKHPYKTAALSGLLLAASYPPLPFGFLSSVAWVPLFFLLESRGPKETFKHFVVFGFIATAGTLYWIGNVVAPGLWHMVLMGVVLLCVYFSLYFGVAGLWAHALMRWKGACALVFFPPFWVLIEFIKSKGEISFPWCTIGYTWGDYLPLLQMLSMVGVYAYSLLIGELGVALFLLVKRGYKNRFAVIFSVLLLLLVIALGAGGSIYGATPETRGDSLRVSVAQPNINQLEKWDAAFTNSTVTAHLNMTRTAVLAHKPDLVVWSETSLPMYFLKQRTFVATVKALADSLAVPLVFGSLDYTLSAEAYKQLDFYNCAFWYMPVSGRFDCYRKIKLVPFSECLPFTGVFPLLNMVDLGEADFSAGNDQILFKLNGARISPSICYEMTYPSFVRSAVVKGANLLVNITNDGWFGRTSGPYQHLNIARYRCIENRIWLVRCANSGISAMVDPAGRIRARTALKRRELLNGTVYLRNTPTFYSRAGDLVVAGCVVVLLIPCGAWGAGYMVRCKKRSKESLKT